MVFDVLVLIVLLVSALIAFLRGAIREILTILGVVGGLAAAWYAGPLLIPHMEGWLGVKEGVEPEKLLGILPYDLLAHILSYGLIFIVVVIILSIISHMIAETARAIGLGPVDRTLGVIFGLARGVLLLGVIYFPFHLMLGPEEKEQWFEGSKTFFYVEQTSQAMVEMLPEETVAKFQKDAESIKEGVDTREKLQQMDVLKKNDDSTSQPAPSDGKGYNEEFREDMDRLFENKPAPTEPAEKQPGVVQPPNE
jgi:membrane protein required for colicin V production